jgi:hypothetical protein
MWLRRPTPVLVAVLAVAGLAPAASDTPWQPFARLFTDVHINAADRTKLDAHTAIVKVLPGASRELAVAAAVRVDAPPERLIAWTRNVVALQRGKYVPLIARFSDPPQIEDLEGLTLDPGDVRDLETCRPGRCGVKLSAPEITRLTSQLTSSSGTAAVQEEFRQIVLDRARQYLADGDAGLPPYHDDKVPMVAVSEVALLLPRMGLAAPHLPGITDYLQWFPRVAHPQVVDSFLYWARESLGAKPIASVTHVTIVTGDAAGPVTLAISKQVFASHYRDGAMSVTALTGEGDRRTLLYVHRSHVDVLQGAFGGLYRSVIERRVRKEAPALLQGLRAKLEGGDPPE